jgi:tRNA (cytidine56-2'-O)-methyltransferase
VTTHLVLVARAFGAKGVFIDGNAKDLTMKINQLVKRWGGSYFKVEEVSDPKKFVIEWKEKGGKVIHLTMYGINIDEIINEINNLNNPILVIVGSEKVERYYYNVADYNIAIGNQPHSEISALAIFLDRLYKGKELNLVFDDAKIKIIPQHIGKKVVKLNGSS